MVKICILDSGYDQALLRKYNTTISGINFLSSNYLLDCNDLIGHGTAIVDNILKVETKLEIIMCKIFEEVAETDEDTLISVLEYIYEKIECDILHMSFGITECAQFSRLKKICADFTNRNTIIVSAFDNMGSISYPAAFEGVIGVDSCQSAYSKRNYIYIDGSIANISLNIGMRRIKVNNEEKIFTGSSFSAAYITGIIAKMLNYNIQKNMIMNELRKNALKVIDYKNDKKQEASQRFNIKNIQKVIIFPFNKEIHSLFRYSNMLTFDINAIYDIKFGGKIGRSISVLLQNFPSDNQDYIVQDYLNIDWDSDFDTVILGHIEKISNALNIDLLEYFINKSKAHGKKVFCLDQNLEIKEKNVYFSNIKDYLFDNTYGKYHKIVSPIIGVFGTSASQGKFSLQLSLRKLFIENDFKVGQLGTEPQSELFGFDFTFPFGYGVKKYNLDDNVQSLLVNNMIGAIDHKEVDIIICGSQSGTIPYQLNNTIQSTFPQMVFAHSIKADISILCINPHDDIEYIKRNIYFLESVAGNKVLALVLFPIKKTFYPSGFFKTQLLDKNELDKLARKYEEQLGINTFTMEDRDIRSLYNNIIKYLT